MVKCLIIYRIKKHPMSIDGSSGAPHGASHVSVPISSFIRSDVSPPLPVANLLAALQKKFGWAAIVIALLQILGLIIVVSLWQTGNEAARIVVLCMGYFSTYFLVVLGSFVETDALDLRVEIQFHRLQLKFTVLKFLLILQLACIYLQRAIVPDLWIFAISYLIFLIMSVVVIRACLKIYKSDNTKKLFLLTLSIFVCVVVISQTVYFGLYANAYATTALVQTKLPMGALFVSILFGQIANIVMIVMTKIWKVNPEVSGTDV